MQKVKRAGEHTSVGDCMLCMYKTLRSKANFQISNEVSGGKCMVCEEDFSWFLRSQHKNYKLNVR